MSKEAKIFFCEVKPFCIAAVKNRSKHSVEQLHNFIKNCSTVVLQELHEYLLFPLRVILIQESKAKENAILASASCMQWIFNKIIVQEWKTFQDLYFILTMQITSNSAGKIVPTGSEEKKINVLLALRQLLSSSFLQHGKLFYEVNHISAIGHLISICLSIVTNEKNKQLRKIAIGVIEILSMPSLTVNLKENILLQFLVGNCIASFLPGILSVLIKVVSGDVQQGHMVKCKAIDAISKAIIAAGGDEEIEIFEHSIIKQYISDIVVSEQLSSFLIQRDSNWVENVGSKMSTVLDHVTTAGDHSNARVRMSVLNFSHQMLLSCSKKIFKSHVGTLLQIPCKLLNDNSPDISTKSIQVIDQFSECSKGNAFVQDIVQEDLLELCNRLPAIISKAADCEKLAHLKVILGFLEVLKYDLQSFSHSHAHVFNLFKSLLFCFQMDHSSLHKIEEVTSTTLDYDKTVKNFYKGQSDNWLFKKSFIHFHDDELCRILVKICRVLGKFGDVDVFLERLKELYESENLCRPTVLLINEILLGAKNNQLFSDKIFSEIETLIGIYTSNKNWYLCTSFNFEYATLRENSMKSKQTLISLGKTSNAANMTLKAINSNVILVCLQIEAMAAFSLILLKDFRKTLSKTLYPLLEKVNDRNHLISNCALEALHVVALSCQYKNVSELITANADYLVSTISIYLRQLNLFPRCPSVLRAMITHCDVTIFPLIRDTIDEIICTIDIERQNKLFLEAFLPVIKSIVKAINEWFAKKIDFIVKNSKDIQFTDVPEGSAQNITNYLANFYKDFKLASLDESEVKKAEESSSNNVDIEPPIGDASLSDNYTSADETKKVTAHIKVVEQIVQRCSHLLTNKDPRVRLLVIDIVAEGIECLRAEKNVFLPLVHKLWNPLTSRCRDPELQIVAKAFGVISFMGEHCGSFIRRRFTKDVLPNITAFLKQNSELHINSSTILSHTTLFKLQVAVLRGLGPLLLGAAPNYKDIYTICCACQSYLSSSQPVELQNAALALFEALIKIDPDSTWLFLSDIWTPPLKFNLSEADTNFKLFAIAGSSDKHSSFAVNFSKLLKLCS